jgi:hypothetical protein
VTNQPPPDEESLRLELKEAITAFREQAGHMTQGIGFTVAADSALLAYGFSQRISGILLIASVMPILALFVFFLFRHVTTPSVYVAIVLERQLRLESAPLMATHARKFFKQVYELVANSKDPADKSVSDSVLARSYRDSIKHPIPCALYCISVAQLLVFAISMTASDYRFM